MINCLRLMTVVYVVSVFCIPCVTAGWWHQVKCVLRIGDCCNDKWSDENLTILEHKFNTKLHGQHLVREVVLSALRGHMESPRKALAMSFHGWTGTGKSYVSQMVAESMFDTGMKSKFVHHYLATHHFPHSNMVSKYKDEIRTKITSSVSDCDRSLFIFDEIDQMPGGIIDVVRPYIEYHDNIDKISYKKAVFIFISNAGSTGINKKAMEFKNGGKVRETILMSDMEELVGLAAFNVEGGLQNSNIIDKHLIDHFVPFLPLERAHVKKCVLDVFARRGHHQVDEAIVEEVAGLIPYFPDGSDIYSKTGCKRIPQKVSITIEKYKRRKSEL